MEAVFLFRIYNKPVQNWFEKDFAFLWTISKLAKHVCFIDNQNRRFTVTVPNVPFRKSTSNFRKVISFSFLSNSFKFISKNKETWPWYPFVELFFHQEFHLFLEEWFELHGNRFIYTNWRIKLSQTTVDKKRVKIAFTRYLTDQGGFSSTRRP